MRLRALIGLALVAAPALADDIVDLERELASSPTAVATLGMAQQQADRGQLLEALASAERVRFLDPKSKQARLLHATLLCRLDDPQGAAVEWNALRKKDFKKAEWKRARASCPALFGEKD